MNKSATAVEHVVSEHGTNEDVVVGTDSADVIVIEGDSIDTFNNDFANFQDEIVAETAAIAVTKDEDVAVVTEANIEAVTAIAEAANAIIEIEAEDNNCCHG